ncbi:hypothetical protein CH276_11910 [Rhodococcus sp. 06-470-2]|uniref:hypothetical protein n=1 Tax=unclassified Rhodococcus (in: high G+C Gram-positive bacteria) TaxID=192944 RepID=UPI000B9B8B14|nr:MULTISPECIES: hypothetical protein [unclassified Rhodococcus (in: high G+C Gram-positive bacteria)]OZC64341.1 hypothetical protein CH276_11910 [Rhodococcus sp. 06-470-2]OZE56880.1 hypothetical protein CH265_25440 [Rhodococcus sp. 05-2221-1B]
MTARTTTQLLAALALVGVAAAGCGADEPAPSPTAAPSSVPAPDPLLGTPITDSGVLAAAMLGLGDLPDGFSSIPDPVQDLGLDPAPEYDSPDRSGTDPSECAAVLAPISEQRGGATSTAVARFSGPNFSSIDEDAASYSDTGTAEAFTAIQQAWAGCTTFSGTDADGVSVDYALAGREQSSVGDASASVRLTTSSEGFTLISDVVVAVVDSTVVQIVVSDRSGLEPDTVTAVAEAAVERIRSVTPSM